MLYRVWICLRHHHPLFRPLITTSSHRKRSIQVSNDAFFKMIASLCDHFTGGLVALLHVSALTWRIRGASTSSLRSLEGSWLLYTCLRSLAGFVALLHESALTPRVCAHWRVRGAAEVRRAHRGLFRLPLFHILWAAFPSTICIVFIIDAFLYQNSPFRLFSPRLFVSSGFDPSSRNARKTTCTRLSWPRSQVCKAHGRLAWLLAARRRVHVC